MSRRHRSGLTLWEFRPLVMRNGTIGWKLLQSMAMKLRTVQGDPASDLAPGGGQG